MKILIIALVIILGVLQYELWFSNNGVRQYFALKHAVEEQQKENAALVQRNQAISREIKSLKTDKQMTEEYARNDLGMVKSDETFYQIVDK